MISVDTKIAITILEQLEKDVFEQIRVCVQKYSLMVETMAKDKAPTDIGYMKGKIMQQLYLYSSEIVGSVGTNVNYAFWRHEGTRPHWVPFYNPPTWDADSGVRNYGILQWAKRHGFPVDGVKGSDGKWIKRPMTGLWVDGHADPFIKEAFDYYEPMFQREIEEIIEKAVRKLNG